MDTEYWVFSAGTNCSRLATVHAGGLQGQPGVAPAPGEVEERAMVAPIGARHQVTAGSPWLSVGRLFTTERDGKPPPKPAELRSNRRANHYPDSPVSGGGGIRTHEAQKGPTVFKTVALDRSATPPGSPDILASTRANRVALDRESAAWSALRQAYCRSMSRRALGW
jgi:hypothetical protein